MMRAAAMLIFAATFVVGCVDERAVQIQPVEVKVPVPVQREVPAALLEKPEYERPVFYAPGTPGVTSCLMSDGEGALRDMIAGDRGRLDAWEAWGTTE